MYESGDNILIHAVKTYDLKTVEMILKDEKIKIDINHQNAEGRTALMYACDSCKESFRNSFSLETIYLLVEKGAQLNIVDVKNKSTPLIEVLNACCILTGYGEKCSDMFKNIIIEMADNTSAEYLNYQDYESYTAFMVACSIGCIELIDHFLKLNVDVSLKQSEDCTALDLIADPILKSITERLMESYKDHPHVENNKIN